MSAKFYEAVKSFLQDIEDFLTISLKSANLSKSVSNDKEDLLTTLKALRTEYPQLTVEIREKTPVAVSQQEREAKADSQEIYDDIGGGGGGEEEVRERSESPKPASIHDFSESQTALSAATLTMSATMCGNLVRKNVGKSKMDIKNIFLSVFGKKYCLVSGGVFFFYDKLSSKKANGSFPLKGYEARVLLEQQSKKEFCFELVCPGQKSYVFAAASQEEMDKWVTVLNSESLKIPDARLSVFFGDTQGAEDEDIDYEDPTPTASNQTASIQKLKAKPLPTPKSPVIDEEFYDDVVHDAKETKAIKPVTKTSVADDDGEIYDEAESKVQTDEQEDADDDMLYEAYDDVREPDTSSNQTMTTLPAQGKNEIPAAKTQEMETQYDKMYYGKWDCKADCDNELAFKRGDIVQIISQEYDKFGWWVGYFQGIIGLVPLDYMTPAYELISS